jgi:hypothetical protein
MPNIKPVTDLRNYIKIINEVKEDRPVYLTNNGRGEYKIVKLRKVEKLKSSDSLLEKLEKAKKTAKEKGALSPADVEDSLGL